MKRVNTSVLFLTGAAALYLIQSAPAGPAVGAHSSGFRSSGGYSSGPAYVVPSTAMPSSVAPPLMSAEFAPVTPRPAGSEEEQEPTAPATILASVPANAEIWLDGKQTRQAGSQRLFVTPPLERGQSYSYEVRVHWTARDGTIVDLTRVIRVQAGRQTNLGVAAP